MAGPLSLTGAMSLGIGGPRHTAPAVAPIQTMDYWWDSRQITSADQQTLENRGAAGSSLLQRGSAAGVDANDPTFTVGGPITTTATTQYLQSSVTPDFTGGFVIVVAFRTATSDNTGVKSLASSESATVQGLYLICNNSSGAGVGFVGDGVAANQAATLPTDLVDTTRHVLAMSVNAAATEFRIADDVTGFSAPKSLAAFGTIPHATLRFFTRGFATSSTLVGDINHIAIHQSAMDDADVLDVISDLKSDVTP